MSTDANALLRLLQLTSPALPVGAYAQSHGLEQAVCAGWVKDEQSAHAWVLGLMQHACVFLDVPVCARMYHAWQRQERDELAYWSRFLNANREAAELQQADRRMGAALSILLSELGLPEAKLWPNVLPYVNYPLLFTLAASRWHIPLATAVSGYLWSWCENQVLAAVKLVPLGQTAGQRILAQLITGIDIAAAHGLALKDEEIGFLAPGQAMASALHETQYARLFCS